MTVLKRMMRLLISGNCKHFSKTFSPYLTAADDEIRDTYNEGVFDLFRAAYDYMDAGGSVKIRCVRELYYADIFDTVENIHGVVVEFIT